MDRPLTHRERAVLDHLLAVEHDGAEGFRAQADAVRVVGGCSCGCPSIDFTQADAGIRVLVDAAVEGTTDGLFLFARGDRLGGIEYVGTSDETAVELPDPRRLRPT